jgi:hypothetical protein
MIRVYEFPQKPFPSTRELRTNGEDAALRTDGLGRCHEAVYYSSGDVESSRDMSTEPQEEDTA